MYFKAASIQNLTDARYFASHAVDWMGFCFDSASKSYISPREAQQIMAWVEGPGIIGEFGNQSLKEIKETALILGLQGIQLDIERLPEAIDLTGLALIVNLKPQEKDTLQDIKTWLSPYSGSLEYILIDLTANFNSWEAFLDKSQLGLSGIEQLVNAYPVMLATQFNKDNIATIMNAVNPAAIQLSGTAEQKTGEKLFDELEEIFSILAV